jgi:hypothetical protein
MLTPLEQNMHDADDNVGSRPPPLSSLPVPLGPGEKDWPGWRRISRKDHLRMLALSGIVPSLDAGVADGW